MPIDWTPIEQAAITAAAAIITTASVVAVAYIRSHVKNVEAAAILSKAETIGAGIAHDALTTAVANGAPNWAAAKQAAIAEGMEAAIGVSRMVTEDGVTAALAPLLAVDPTVPAGVSPSATATAPAGGTAEATADGSASAGLPGGVHAIGDDARPISRTLGVILALAVALGTSACTTGQLATTRTALDDVRLFCAVGQSVVAVSTATGTPILAQGTPKAAVDTFCALAGGVAVSPPDAPVATVTIPAVTVPVGAGK